MDTVTAAATAATTLAGPPWHGGPPPFAPILGALMFCLLIALALCALFFTVMRRRGGPPPWVRAHTGAPRTSPEEDARRTLADRFAKGDLTVEEFMERASALNWTPGSDEGPRRR
ncbi:SHOCT domain-containing protein [Nocardiopsis aegyptia]|uniref:Putative membrane protein n=1 Tax=Nocardiopsis aegyptia TaxID=220378 RepID=A0A7Z0EUC3_9ACTN|nr:SHOCT domain-containing protein [Nocardiopsis aegyptia]NYJ38082.1 putative membrane protein [Nocardiopsis aegyptia]